MVYSEVSLFAVGGRSVRILLPVVTIIGLASFTMPALCRFERRGSESLRAEARAISHAQISHARRVRVGASRRSASAPAKRVGAPMMEVRTPHSPARNVRFRDLGTPLDASPGLPRLLAEVARVTTAARLNHRERGGTVAGWAHVARGRTWWANNAESGRPGQNPAAGRADIWVRRRWPIMLDALV
ncbi:MAG: hypothetical protein ABGY41_07655 [Candidatus Poribacteria bacterium]